MGVQLLGQPIPAEEINDLILVVADGSSSEVSVPTPHRRVNLLTDELAARCFVKCQFLPATGFSRKIDAFHDCRNWTHWR